MTSTESVSTGMLVPAWDVAPLDNIVSDGSVMTVTRIEKVVDHIIFSGPVWPVEPLIDVVGASRVRTMFARRTELMWIVWERGVGEW